MRQNEIDVGPKFWLKLLFSEAAFLLAVAIVVVLTVVCVVAGMLNVVTLPFRRRAAKAFVEPFRQVGALWKRIGAHLRYLYRAEFLPRHQKMMSLRQERQRVKLAEAASKEAARANSRRDVRRARFYVDSPEFEAVDGFMLLLLVLDMTPLLLLAPHLIISTVGLLSVMGYMAYYDSTPEPRMEPLPETTTEYQPQVVDRQEADYGPWYDRGDVVDLAVQPSFKNLALISDDGTVRYSRRLSAEPAGFVPSNSEKVSGARILPDGRVSFSDQYRNRYVLNSGQGFLFENYKTYAFMFDGGGRLLAVKASELQTKEIGK